MISIIPFLRQIVHALSELTIQDILANIPGLLSLLQLIGRWLDIIRPTHRAKRKLKKWDISKDRATLFEYVRAGNLSIVETILKAGIYVDIRLEHNTPLIFAAWYGHADIARLLLKWKADKDAEGAHSNTALMAAIAQDHQEVALLLRDNNASESGVERAAFLLAASAGSLEKVRAADREQDLIRARDLVGDTALIRAADVGHAAVVKVLLELGASPTAHGQEGKSAVEVARLRGHDEIVEILEAKAGIRDPGSARADVLEYAEGGDVGAIADRIDQAGLNPTDLEGATPLILASREGQFDAVRFLLEKGAEKNHQDEHGRTALLEACARSHAGIARLLLGEGASPELADLEGETPIMAAIRGGHAEVVRILRKEGWTKGEREAGLMAAVEGGDLRDVRSQLKGGANVNFRLARGRTPLIAACELGHLEIVRVLLAKAELEDADSDGITPIGGIHLTGVGAR